MKMHSAFQRGRAPHIRAMKNGEPSKSEILLYDEIGFWGVTAKDFVAELNALTADEVTVRINSPGGDVFEGLTIANAMRAHPARVTVQIDGLAASIASVIALAGEQVTMAENAFLMIHNPFTIAMGDAEAFRKTASTLDKIGLSLVGEYTRRTGATTAQVQTWMAEETWFSAEEALAANFIDAVGDEASLAAVAQFDLSIFGRTPERFAAALAQETVPVIRTVERALRDAGFSRSSAKQMASAALAVGSPREADSDEAVVEAVLAAGKTLLQTITTST